MTSLYFVTSATLNGIWYIVQQQHSTGYSWGYMVFRCTISCDVIVCKQIENY